MYASSERHSRTDIVAMLIASFGADDIAIFAPKGEEELYLENKFNDVSKDECTRLIKEDMTLDSEEISNLSDIHPAWILKALESESPKIIGIILRWLPSRHVRYILEHLPKRVKMNLPKLVDSFAVPTPILNLVKRGFERKFQVLKPRSDKKIASLNDIVFLSPDDLEKLFRDLGIHELAMAFNGIDQAGIRVLLNRMNVTSARMLQSRIKSVAETNPALLKDARYTILEVALDQEDVERLLMEIGMAAFSKAMKDLSAFPYIQMKLDPTVSYIFKRHVNQHASINKLATERQALILERLGLLIKAGEIL